MFERCPGTNTRFLKVKICKCPNCGYEVEVFSDEFKVKCPKCKKAVYRENIPSCIDWCKYAKECIGPEKYKQLKQRNKSKQGELKGRHKEDYQVEK